MSSLRKQIRYRFDNYMSKGIGAQIALLGVVTLILLLITSIALQVYGGTPQVGDDGTIKIVHESFARDLWQALMHTFDAGTLGGDPFAWGFLFIMLFVTVGGIFVVSALIGVINNGLGGLIESLRRGRSEVIESGHTVILGFSPKVHTLLHELGVAGENQKNPCVVILADRDKVAMDDEVHPAVAGSKLRVVTRGGNPMSLTDLELVNLAGSKSVIVLAPEGGGEASVAAHEADTVVLKTLLAVSKVAHGHDIHIVAELQDVRTEAVARMVVGPKAALIVSPPLISRLLVQTGRQSGLSMVYQELLDFGGVEMYIQTQDKLLGQTFRDAVYLYDTSTLMGVVTGQGEILLPPALDRVFVPGDQVIAISEDDDTVVLDGRLPTLDPAMVIASPRQSLRHKERTLVLGASDRLHLVLTELDSYVSPGSETLVLGDGEALGAVDSMVLSLKNQTVDRQLGDITNRNLLDNLDVPSFDHILVLSETAGREQDMADARTMITLLHLRDILQRAGKKVPITSEILEIENRDLAAVAEADDFIVSNTLVALLMSQISENVHLVRVFDDLFTAGGYEIYLKPASEYVPANMDLPYAAVVEAALRRGEVALGIRLAATAKDPKASFGVIVNPQKSAPMRLGPGDKIVVLADD
jgi:hypothetical protein